MATIKKFEELEIWKLARILCKKIFELTKTGNFAKDYTLVGQIKASSGSVMDNIAEGFGRGGNKEFVNFLSIAIGSTCEVQSQLYRSIDNNYITKEEFNYCYKISDEIISKAGSLISYLNSSKHKGEKFKNRVTTNDKLQTTNNMSEKIKFKIDGKECSGEAGQFIIDAAAECGIYVPYLCHMKGIVPAGSCRVCTVKVNGRPMAACTTPVGKETENANIENETPQLEEMRKTIIELLFVEGNHFCPTCEKSGNCELQALAYRYKMMVPQFEYNFPLKKLDALTPKLFIDRNRCILCKKCIRAIKDKDNKSYFAFNKRGAKLEIHVDHDMASSLNDDLAQKAMDNCPVGAILKKEKGFDTPIGKRKFDKKPIGSDIEK